MAKYLSREKCFWLLELVHSKLNDTIGSPVCHISTETLKLIQTLWETVELPFWYFKL